MTLAPERLDGSLSFPTGPPEVPQLVAVDVTGTNSVLVRFQGPEHKDSSICTKFKGGYGDNFKSACYSMRPSFGAISRSI